MNYILLLGAGFSRNWGGWLTTEAFEYLLGCQEIKQNDYLKSLLWKHNKIGGGFEAALAEVQTAWIQDLQQRNFDPRYYSHVKDHLDKFQIALEQMFKNMNKAFSALPDWEFQNDVKYMVRSFLMKFDAIFTLNQDLLLETHYLNDNILLGSSGKWNGWQIPGMRHAVNQYHAYGSSAPVTKCVPDHNNFKIRSNLQPYFKLHGSSEWRDGGTADLLIMGGNKGNAIQSHEILKWYHQEFWSSLAKPVTRLMVIFPAELRIPAWCRSRRCCPPLLVWWVRVAGSCWRLALSH